MHTLEFGPLSKHYIDLDESLGAHNYHPLAVVLARGSKEWVWDVDGKRYLDMLSAYSAINQGHCHPKLQKTLAEQAAKITLTSRAFHNIEMGPWLSELTTLCQMPKAIPMNSGAEAVETAIKLARKWGYLHKKVPADMAEIIVCSDNFHGRTSTIVGFSSEAQYRSGFGPFAPGFKTVPFGDSEAFKNAVTPHTVGFLIEPMQGEAGVVVPPEGYLAAIDKICKSNDVLLIMDEIQTGLGRTGKLFAYQYEDCRPDLLILGKALGGGFYPISAVIGSDEVLSVLKPGDHGSTFGGNPLGCALSRTAMQIIVDEQLPQRAFAMGQLFREKLKPLLKTSVREIRGKGLLNALELKPEYGRGRPYSEELARRGILAKETRQNTIRFAPPLVISEDAMNWALTEILDVFAVNRN